jgi:hypothetical protein
LTKKEEEKKKSTFAAARTVKTIRILDFLLGGDEKFSEIHYYIFSLFSLIISNASYPKIPR